MQITIDTQKDSREEIIEAINFLGQLVNPGATAPATAATPTVDQLLAESSPAADLPGVAQEEPKAAALENEEIIPY